MIHKANLNFYLRDVVFVAFLLVAFGCSKPQINDEPHRFSLKSREISQLLDEEKYEAARLLLKSYIPQAPNDDGLYCQYTRLLVAFYEIENDPRLPTPLFPPNGEAAATEIIKEAARIAVQLEPKNKEWIANTILEGLYLQTKDRTEKGAGIISYSTPGLIKAAWTAIEIEPEISKTWADKFKETIPFFVKSGKAVSAMYMGNLAGDLKGGEKNSGEDFIEATYAFRLAIDAAKSDQDTIRIAWYLYTQLFEKKIKQAIENRNPGYIDLLKSLKEKDYKPAQFVRIEYFPTDLQPTPTPTPTPYMTATPTPTPIPTPTPSPSAKIYLYVTSENLILRSEPNLNSKPILEIESGARLYLLPPTNCRTCAKDGKWFRAHHINTGKEGWISNESEGERTFEFDY